MAIKFWTEEHVRASDNQKFTRDYFEADTGAPMLKDGAVHYPKITGIVDESIIKQHAKEYAEYKSPKGPSVEEVKAEEPKKKDKNLVTKTNNPTIEFKGDVE